MSKATRCELKNDSNPPTESLTRRSLALASLLILLAGCPDTSRYEPGLSSEPTPVATVAPPQPAEPGLEVELVEPKRGLEDIPSLPEVAPPPRTETEMTPALLLRTPPRVETHYIAPAPIAITRIEQPLTGGGVARGVLVVPEVDSPAGAILMLPEWWGLNEPMLEEARVLGGWGFVTLAVDPYQGQVARSRREATELARGLDQNQLLLTLRAASGWLGDEATSHSLPVGVLGWNWGATLALQLGLEEPEIGALALVNPQPIYDEERLGQLAAPLIAFFGSEGGWVGREEISRFRQALVAAGVDNVIHNYTTRPEALLDPQSIQEEAYRETLRQRLREFLTRRLGTAGEATAPAN